MSEKIETRSVLAGAYIDLFERLRFLTHSVELNEHGIEIKVLGGRCVKLEHIADNNDGTDLNKKPTCLRCARKDPRFMEAKKK